MIMEDKMVELKRFTQISDAEMLANLLKSEGIDCYVRDLFINQIYGGGVDFGGIKVELLEKDLPRAKEIMNDFGYLPNEVDNVDKKHQKTTQSRTMTIITLIIILLVAIIMFLNKRYFG